MGDLERRITVADCIEWLNHLDEGATIWDTDLKFIIRIRDVLEQHSDEIDMANAAYAKWQQEKLNGI